MPAAQPAAAKAAGRARAPVPTIRLNTKTAAVPEPKLGELFILGPAIILSRGGTAGLCVTRLKRFYFLNSKFHCDLLLENPNYIPSHPLYPQLTPTFNPQPTSSFRLQT